MCWVFTVKSPTWKEVPFNEELGPARSSSQLVGETVVKEEGCKGQALRVGHWRGVVFWPVEECQGRKIPAKMSPWPVRETNAESNTDSQPQTSCSDCNLEQRERERNFLFNDALNTFYLRLYGVRHMVTDHSDSEKGNPLPPHRLLLSINSKGSFICTIPQTG